MIFKYITAAYIDCHLKPFLRLMNVQRYIIAYLRSTTPPLHYLSNVKYL